MSLEQHLSTNDTKDTNKSEYKALASRLLPRFFLICFYFVYFVLFVDNSL